MCSRRTDSCSGWAEVIKPVTATGPVDKDTERRCYELGATVAANLL